MNKEPSVAQVVEAYLSQRRRKEELEREHKEALKPIKERMERAENFLLDKMLDGSMNHIAVAAGTAYVKARTSCSVVDWEAFFDHMKEGDNWHMLNHGANKTAVAQYLAEFGELPPGVKWTSENIVQVRKNSK